MLWPLVLPFQITCLLLGALVLFATIQASNLKRSPRKTFAIAALLAFVGFIPSCSMVMKIIDAQRFGIFKYDSYDQVNDFRIERFLPPAARNITLEKTAAGHRAKYSISESELKSYVDGLWKTYGEYSAIPRDNLKDGEPATSEEIEMRFQDLNWPSLNNAVQFHSPVEGDGGGTTYYFDATSGVAYHRAGYW